MTIVHAYNLNTFYDNTDSDFILFISLNKSKASSIWRPIHVLKLVLFKMGQNIYAFYHDSEGFLRLPLN